MPLREPFCGDCIFIITNKLMLSSQKSTQSKILDFIKYHNGFVLGLVLALFGGAAIFAASPEAREAVLGKEIVSQTGVDNGALLAADLGNFDFQMKIENVGEDDGNYYVDYSFQTLGIQNNVWQTAPRHASMKIDKSSLAGEDLGLYVQKQLAQIAQNERDYLRQAQNAEIGKGLTRVVRTTEYTGLIGLVLDAKNAILPGYDPVVKPAPIELSVALSDAPKEDGKEFLENNSRENDNNPPLIIDANNNQPPVADDANNNQSSAVDGPGNDQLSIIGNSSNSTTTEEVIIPPSQAPALDSEPATETEGASESDSVSATEFNPAPPPGDEEIGDQSPIGDN